MKIAVLGGSFNPIHIAHLALADEVCTLLGYDKVLFVPVFNPPHKEMNSALSPQMRLELVEKALADDGRFIAEPCEIERGGISYTCDTIKFLMNKYKDSLDDKIGLIMGDDLFAGFHLWQEAGWLAENCTLILARRPWLKEEKSFKNIDKGGYADVSHGETLFDITKEPLFKDAVTIENAMLHVSSTDIRSRIAEGRAFRYLVPPQVFEYIKDKGLYGFC